jgi:hypothetical protein
MATLTQIEQAIDSLARTVGDDIQELRNQVAALGGGGAGSVEWASIANKPLTFAPSAHTHTAAEIVDFEAEVDALIAATPFTAAWGDITGKPATFTPSAHTHVVAEITDFETEVNALIAGAGVGDGNVSGPAGGVVNNEIAVYNGTSGLAIKASGIVPSADGISLIEAANFAAMVSLLGVSTGDVAGPAGGVADNEIAVYSGTGGKTLKASGIVPTANGIALIEANYAGMKALLDLEIGTDVQAWDAQLDALAAQTWAADKLTYQTGASTLGVTDLTAFGRAWIAAGDSDAARGQLALKEHFAIALSDETTAITTGANKARHRFPYAIKNIEVSAYLKTVSSSGVVTVDVNEGGASILSTKCTIDAGELTSSTAATSPVLSDTTIAAYAEVTFDIDTAGAGAVALVAVLTYERA